MTFLICGGRCIVCGNEVDPHIWGWGEEEPSLCRRHGSLRDLQTRCKDVLPPRIRCALAEGHAGKHIRYPLAWGVSGVGPPP